MRHSVLKVDARKERYELYTLVDSTETDRGNSILRRLLGKGFTQGKTLRHVANIDIDEYAGLLAIGDKDALDFEQSGRTNRKALRRLLARHPQWFVSEGGI